MTIEELQIPDFLLAQNRAAAKKFRRAQTIKYTRIKPTPCPKGYKPITLHLGDELFPQVGTGNRHCYYKEGRKWVYVKEAKPNARAKKISLDAFKKLITKVV